MPAVVLLRGGGDLASGVALRLHRAGLQVLITELPQPLVVRRLVSFAEAVYAGEITVEGAPARRVENLEQALALIERKIIPVLVDPEAAILTALREVRSPIIFVDGRMTKQPHEFGMEAADLVIGLGPGFYAGENCHVVIETNRGHNLGRTIWAGPAEANTGQPEAVGERRSERVLRAPQAGFLQACTEIGDHLEAGQAVAEVNGASIRAPFRGVLRGLLHDGLPVTPGMKVGDVDPRADPSFCRLVSDKAMAIGGGVLEAILTRTDLRPHLWD